MAFRSKGTTMAARGMPRSIEPLSMCTVYVWLAASNACGRSAAGIRRRLGARARRVGGARRGGLAGAADGRASGGARARLQPAVARAVAQVGRLEVRAQRGHSHPAADDKVARDLLRHVERLDVALLDAVLEDGESAVLAPQAHRVRLEALVVLDDQAKCHLAAGAGHVDAVAAKVQAGRRRLEEVVGGGWRRAKAG